MSQTLVSIPLGSTGALAVTESAGKVGISITESIDVGAFLQNLSDNSSNAELKAILATAAAAVKALPA